MKITMRQKEGQSELSGKRKFVTNKRFVKKEKNKIWFCDNGAESCQRAGSASARLSAAAYRQRPDSSISES